MSYAGVSGRHTNHGDGIRTMEKDPKTPPEGGQTKAGDKDQSYKPRLLLELEEEDFLYKTEDKLAGVRAELVAMVRDAIPGLENTVENTVIMIETVVAYRLLELRVQLATVIERRFAELEERIEREK